MLNLSPLIDISHKNLKPIKDAPVCKEQVVVLRVVACQHQSPSCLLRVAELQVTTRTEGRDTRTSAADDPPVSQSVFTIAEKASTSRHFYLL